MLKSGSVVKFNLSNQKYILLGLNCYNDRNLELDVEIIKEVLLFYPEINGKGFNERRYKIVFIKKFLSRC